MWSLLRKNGKDCGRFRESLEERALVEVLPPELKEHATACKDCRAAAEEMVASRALLKALPPQADAAKPWFAPRVMAAVAARELELRRSLDALTVVPKMAAKLTWVSAGALLLASTWLYERPASTPARPVASDLTAEMVFESSPPPSNNDEFLGSLPEKAQ